MKANLFQRLQMICRVGLILVFEAGTQQCTSYSYTTRRGRRLDQIHTFYKEKLLLYKYQYPPPHEGVRVRPNGTKSQLVSKTLCCMAPCSYEDVFF